MKKNEDNNELELEEVPRDFDEIVEILKLTMPTGDFIKCMNMVKALVDESPNASKEEETPKFLN